MFLLDDLLHDDGFEFLIGGLFLSVIGWVGRELYLAEIGYLVLLHLRLRGGRLLGNRCGASSSFFGLWGFRYI